MSKKKVDAKELLLAKLLQNAHANNLGWCRGTLYRYADGERYACCAVGAASLSPDSEREISHMTGVIDGNDSLRTTWDSWNPDDCEDIGYAFKMAMTISEDPNA